MTSIARPVSYYFAAALLLLSAALAAANWYLQPARAGAPFVALVLVACMTFALLRSPRLPEDEAARRKERDSMGTGILFAGSILVVSLGMKLVTSFGGAGDVEISWRAVMAILGAFFVFTGNAVPKTLRPLAALQCDPARVQAFQRFAGWTWVLTGLALALAWLALPLSVAEPMTFVLLPGAMLLIAVQLLRLRRTRHTAA